MHPNPVYRSGDTSRSLDYARQRGFGLLTINGADVPLISHVPFLIAAEGEYALLHLVRSNPIARSLNDGPLTARIAVSGPDGYVSPDWYGANDQVPTWNYVAVHLTGSLTLLPQERLRDVIDAESALFEARLAPKPAWTSAKMTPEVLDRMMRQIVPCQFEIETVDATWKLNQNKPEDVRLRAADAIEKGHVGHETAVLAALMRVAGQD